MWGWGPSFSSHPLALLTASLRQALAAPCPGCQFRFTGRRAALHGRHFRAILPLHSPPFLPPGLAQAEWVESGAPPAALEPPGSDLDFMPGVRFSLPTRAFPAPFSNRTPPIASFGAP